MVKNKSLDLLVKRREIFVGVFVKRPLLMAVVKHPFTKMISEIKTSATNY